ncbi:hypothetical protein GH714_019335 [Hevea brasiliensis]|uniref:DUF4283 domain-containing protein n=1 Tax=Hevea brasiliensis TaxID=3981 RepID=A0A6A6LHT8_HEVBR|nr:hypothetical protein GH714_019335 [Hevea brasiliensis]
MDFANMILMAIEDKDEDEVLVSDFLEEQAQQENLDYYLIGRFLTERTINFNVMRNIFANLWCPGSGVCIKEVGPKLFSFQFFHPVDLKSRLGYTNQFCEVLFENGGVEPIRGWGP